MQRRQLWYSLLTVAVTALLLVVVWVPQTLAQRSSSTSPPLRGSAQTYEAITMPEASAYSVFTTDGAIPHQVWYRVSGGDALFRQRLRVYREQALPRPQNQLPPESARVQEVLTNTPTGWFVLPSATGPVTYYFDGDHRVRANAPWENALGLRVQRTRFSNGNLYDLGFEDQVGLDDFNDIEVQVAILQPA